MDDLKQDNGVNPAAEQWSDMEPEKMVVDLKSPEFTGKFREKGEI